MTQFSHSPQTLPQAPQWLRLLSRFVSQLLAWLPSQLPRPAAQTHSPPVQAVVAQQVPMPGPQVWPTLRQGAAPAAPAGGSAAAGHLRKVIRVGAKPAAALTAATLDIVTERFDQRPFDLVVVTNVLPYFDDVQLMLALSNIAAMLAPGGVLLHNEARALLQEVAPAVGLPFAQSRHVVIATVRGAAAPLFDSVWIHEKRPGR